MEINLHCIRCGGRLGVEEQHVVCLNCDTEYSNIIISESREENDENIAVEMSVSIDCVLIRPKLDTSLATLESQQIETAQVY